MNTLFFDMICPIAVKIPKVMKKYKDEQGKRQGRNVNKTSDRSGAGRGSEKVYALR